MNEKIKELRLNTEKAQCFFSKRLAYTWSCRVEKFYGKRRG